VESLIKNKIKIFLMALKEIDFEGAEHMKRVLDAWCGDMEPEDLASDFLSCDSGGRAAMGLYVNSQDRAYQARFQGEINRVDTSGLERDY
jgi:hypothetical protein